MMYNFYMFKIKFLLSIFFLLIPFFVFSNTAQAETTEISFFSWVDYGWKFQSTDEYFVDFKVLFESQDPHEEVLVRLELSKGHPSTNNHEVIDYSDVVWMKNNLINRLYVSGINENDTYYISLIHLKDGLGGFTNQENLSIKFNNPLFIFTGDTAGDIVDYGWQNPNFPYDVSSEYQVDAAVDFNGPPGSEALVRFEWGKGNPLQGSDQYLGISEIYSVPDLGSQTFTLSGLTENQEYYISLIQYFEDAGNGTSPENNVSIEFGNPHIFSTGFQPEVTGFFWNAPEYKPLVATEDNPNYGQIVTRLSGIVEVEDEELESLTNIKLYLDYGNSSNGDFSIGITDIFYPNVDGTFYVDIPMPLDADPSNIFYGHLYQVINVPSQNIDLHENLSDVFSKPISFGFLDAGHITEGPYVLENLYFIPQEGNGIKLSGFVYTQGSNSLGYGASIQIQIGLDGISQAEYQRDVLIGQNGQLNEFFSPIEYGETYYVRVIENGTNLNLLDTSAQAFNIDGVIDEDFEINPESGIWSDIDQVFGNIEENNSPAADEGNFGGFAKRHKGPIGIVLFGFVVLFVIKII
jgi:hypothetical protein